MCKCATANSHMKMTKSSKQYMYTMCEFVHTITITIYCATAIETIDGK